MVIFGEEGFRHVQSVPFLPGVAISLAYYIGLESLTSRTLGKLVTGTKVVNEDGGAPSLGQIVGRSFARFIPFEAFSFLFTEGRGWHDSIRAKKGGHRSEPTSTKCHKSGGCPLFFGFDLRCCAGSGCRQ